MELLVPGLVPGLVLGVAVAAPVGPMALLCLQRTVARGLGAGPAAMRLINRTAALALAGLGAYATLLGLLQAFGRL